MTEGEEFIADFLNSENIKYQREVVISKLSNDSKKFRQADFYIPKYKVYVEFFGQWYNDSQKERYREKRNVYKLNSIPCVFLYPENLGIIEYIFHKRLTEQLVKHDLKKELWNYRAIELWKERSENFFWLALSIVVLLYNWPWYLEENRGLVIILLIVVIYQLYRITASYKRILKYGPKNKRIFY